MNGTKAWYESKTFWFNVLMTVIDVISLAMDMQIGGTSLALYLAFLHGMGNIVLRVWFTETRLTK